MSDTTLYDFKVKNNKHQEVDLSTYKGKVVVVVNVASKCGFTPQYKGLQALYDEYKEKGLEILGFPCNQFGGQEPGSNEEIEQFCSLNYSVSFPIMDKVDVRLFAFFKNINRKR
jgi:glutathione peroxidase